MAEYEIHVLIVLATIATGAVVFIALMAADILRELRRHRS